MTALAVTVVAVTVAVTAASYLSSSAHRSQVTGHNAHATSALFFYRDTRRLIRRCANMLRMLHGPRQRGTAHDTRKGHCTTTSWHRAREADLHGGPRMHDRMGDWMNRMEFLEPWRRIYAGPRVRSAHPVLHSRPAFAAARPAARLGARDGPEDTMTRHRQRGP